MIDVQENIRQKMKERGISVTKLAEMMETSQSSLSATLRSRNISLAVVDRIATALHVRPWEFFISEDELKTECARRTEAAQHNTARVGTMCPNCGEAIFLHIRVN